MATVPATLIRPRRSGNRADISRKYARRATCATRYANAIATSFRMAVGVSSPFRFLAGTPAMRVLRISCRPIVGFLSAYAIRVVYTALPVSRRWASGFSRLVRDASIIAGMWSIPRRTSPPALRARRGQPPLESHRGPPGE